jgi:hypothetical protein
MALKKAALSSKRTYFCFLRPLPLQEGQPILVFGSFSPGLYGVTLKSIPVPSHCGHRSLGAISSSDLGISAPKS